MACTWQFPGISRTASLGLSLPVLFCCSIKLSSSRKINCFPLQGYVGLFFNTKDLFQMDVIPETCAPSQHDFPVLSYHKYLLKHSYLLPRLCSVPPVPCSLSFPCSEAGITKYGGGYRAATALQPREPVILSYLKPAALNSVECNPRRKLL